MGCKVILLCSISEILKIDLGLILAYYDVIESIMQFLFLLGNFLDLNFLESQNKFGSHHIV